MAPAATSAVASGQAPLSASYACSRERFSTCTTFRFELVAAGVSGDLAYTVGYEHTAVSIDGVPAEPYMLRVTHVYRRENGEWKIVHRHADPVSGPPPLDQSPPAKASAP
jgi:ketosteroid isomerase-like protein